MPTTHGLFIVDKRLRVLCVHPTGSADTMWSIPKGGADDNETSLQAAIRELKEETNFNYHDFSNSLEYYEYIGCFPYGVRDKKLRAHIAFFNESFSKMELDLKCLVNIDNSNELECDIVEWKDLSFAFRYLHHTQITALTRVIKNLIKKVQK